MKNHIADYISCAFFLVVMGLACYLAAQWTDASLIYRILYEGL